VNPIQPPLRDGVLYIDNSSMELFTTCSRQAYYYLIRRIELNRDRIALSFGEAFHAVLDHLYRTHGNSYRDQQANASVLAFAARRELHPPPDDYRTTSYLTNAVNKYLTDYPAEAFDIAVMPNGVTAVEVPFAFPLGTVESAAFGTIPVVWTGRLDLVYRSRGRLGVMDHKTTSIMGSQFFAEFEIAHQMYGYVAACEYIFGEAVSEICINGLGCRKPTKTGTMYEFQRHLIPVSAALLEEWHTDCLAIVRDFITHCELGYFPKMTKWCTNKYGPCQYRGICTLDPSMRESAINTSEYKLVTWSPLNSNPHSTPDGQSTSSTTSA
jgi:hypothetical protein